MCPHSLHAATTNFVPLWTSSTTLGNSALFQTGGNVGLGTTAPGARLEVDGSGVGIKGLAISSTGIAVLGNVTAGTGQTFGVLGNSSSTSGIGILGNAVAKSGSTIGVLGQSSSSTGTAGLFNNTAGGNILTGLNNGALKFKVDGSGDVFGAEGTFAATVPGSNALTGKGATANASGGTGGAGVTGVGGNGASTVSQTDGGAGVVATGGVAPNGTSGAGVTAKGGSGGAIGGPGVVAQGGDGFGAGGDCCGGDGLDATGGNFGNGVTAIGGPTNVTGSPGVMAMGGPGGAGPYGPLTGPGISTMGGDGIDAFAGNITQFAGSFSGNVTISGNLSVSGTKQFRIDHPLDPANKYLYHASIESSEVLNLYSGNVTLGADGTAMVQLPDWFETLNAEFRYQLTAIGAAAPNLHIAQEIQNHSFKIGGGTAGMKVSWEVTGIRQDGWEKAHPMIVEAAKPPNERGYYLSPELFNAPPEKSIDWARNPRMMERMKEERQRRAKHTQAVLNR